MAKDNYITNFLYRFREKIEFKYDEVDVDLRESDRLIDHLFSEADARTYEKVID